MTTTVDGELASLSSAEIIARLRANEQARRAADVEELGLLNEVVARGIYAEHGCRDAGTFLAAVLTIPSGEARAKVRTAAAVGPRRHPFTGETLEAAHPQTAAVLGTGAITSRAALAITTAVDTLPPQVVDRYSDGVGSTVEQTILDYAREHDAAEAAKFARELCVGLDHDGALGNEQFRQRRRSADLRRRPDGSGRLEGDLTAEAAELVDVLFDAAAAPAPAEDGTRDLRTPTQRRHDALLTGLRLLVGSGRLPTSGGCRTTVILTADADDFARNTGTARTGHGYAVPMAIAKHWLEPEARAILVLLSKTRGIEAYSTTQRCFTEQQRLAMAARDRGCSYWGCDAPVAWTQAHHVTDWQHTHRTSVDDGALVCGADHRAFENMGWRSIMLNGRPHWVPPAWLDPQQKPRWNNRHDRPPANDRG